MSLNADVPGWQMSGGTLFYRRLSAGTPWPYQYDTSTGQLYTWSMTSGWTQCRVSDLPDHVRIELIAARLENA